MRDPLSRKLFTTRDAREHLRGMGGIMASSPRLAETVAKFQDGGDVIPTVPSPFDVIAQRVPGMSQQEMVGAGLPRMGLPRREVVEMLERVDPNIGPEEFAAMSRQERMAAGFSPLGALNQEYFATRARLLESQFPMQGPPEPPAPVLPRLPAEEFIAVDEFSGLTPEMTDQFQLPERPTPTPQPFTGDGADGAIGFDLFPMDERPTPTPEPEPEPEPEPAPTPEPEEETEAAQAAEAEQAAAAERERQEAAQRAADELRRNQGDDEPGDGFDFDTTFDQMLARLERVMGTKDEDSRQKAMANLAMIGLAIAAGQSPDALTNIAQGALTGMQAIRKESAAEEATQREMRLTALQMASAEVDNRRKLQNALEIAGLRSGGRDPYTRERMRQQLVVAITNRINEFPQVQNPDGSINAESLNATVESLLEAGVMLEEPGDLSASDRALLGAGD